MKKEELVAIGLTEELADKVLEKYGNMIPKERFDEVNERAKTAEQQVKDRDNQIATLKKSATDNEELQKQITDLQKQNKADAEKYANDLKERSRSNSIALALTGKKARNITAVKALLNLEDSDFDDNNELSKTGLAKIDKTVTENAWAFEVEATKQNTNDSFNPKGITPISQNNNTPNDKSGGVTGSSMALNFLKNNGYTVSEENNNN